MNKWDNRFLALCEHISSWSRDPSTKCGAVITRPDNSIVSLGFNGFPRGVDDSEEFYLDRDLKLERIIHAEQNALLYARGNLEGNIIYTWPIPPCAQCAKHIIQVGIKKVVAPNLIPERWEYSMKIMKQLCKEAQVILELKE